MDSSSFMNEGKRVSKRAERLPAIYLVDPHTGKSYLLPFKSNMVVGGAPTSLSWTCVLLFMPGMPRSTLALKTHPNSTSFVYSIRALAPT